MIVTVVYLDSELDLQYRRGEITIVEYALLKRIEIERRVKEQYGLEQSVIQS